MAMTSTSIGMQGAGGVRGFGLPLCKACIFSWVSVMDEPHRHMPALSWCGSISELLMSYFKFPPTIKNDVKGHQGQDHKVQLPIFPLS